MWFFLEMAMALDTLPALGRVALLSFLLACALCAFARVFAKAEEGRLALLYRKGALSALVAVPLLVLLFDVQVPVPVDEYRRYYVQWPTYLTYAVVGIWLVGMLVSLWRLYGDLRDTWRAAAEPIQANSKLQARAEHWRVRLNLDASVILKCEGAEIAWHVIGRRERYSEISAETPTVPIGRRFGTVIVLPAAAANWPVGISDVLILHQLSQLKQNGWRWLLMGRIVNAAYWFAPWVRGLTTDLAQAFAYQSVGLAKAAYRDPEGWHRDVRSAISRCEMLKEVPVPGAAGLVRLPAGARWLRSPKVEPAPLIVADELDGTFEGKWQGTKTRHKFKHTDPYEKAYWLIAVASIVVGLTTTLTLRQASPEFDPAFLNIKWHDQMVRRVRDGDVPSFTEQVEQAEAPSESGH